MTGSERREILKAGGAALTVGLAGCIGPFQDGEGVPGSVEKDPDADNGNENGSGGNGSGFPQVEDYLGDANNYEGSVEDLTGEDSVTVQVGAGNGLAFGPAAIQVDPGTTVTWEWTGEGGGHNVVDEDGKFESEIVSEGGHTFEYTFEESGTTLYYCAPHKGSGMKGAVVVGDGGGGGGSGNGGGGNGGGSGGGDAEEYLSDANNYDSVQDMTGEDSVTVEVGAGNGLAFGPAGIRVDSGTTVTWEWTGEGGGHNVVDEDGKFESEIVSEGGHTFEYTFEESGTTRYYCAPHKASGMKGAVVVE